VAFEQLKTDQASVVFVFYLGNSVALTLVLKVLEISSSVALTVIYSISSMSEDVNHFFAKNFGKISVDIWEL